MRAFFAIALAFLLAGPATAAVKKGPKPLHVAQMSLTGAGGVKKVSGGAAYTGPVDVNGTAWAIWSTRCPSNAFTGSVIDIISSAGTTGSRLSCSTGGVLAAVVSASACATTTGGNTFISGGLCSSLATTCATSCSALTVYDTSGGNNCGGSPCDMFSAVGAGGTNPVVTTSCLSSKICLVGNGTTTCLRTIGTNTALNQPMTISAVVNRTGGTTTRQFFIGNDAQDIGVGWNNVVNTTWAIAGNNDITATAADSTTHAIQLILTQTPASNSSSWYIDGTSTPANDVPGTNGWTATHLNLFSTAACNLNFFNGNWFETGLWASDKSANNSSINSNQHTFWGF